MGVIEIIHSQPPINAKSFEFATLLKTGSALTILFWLAHFHITVLKSGKWLPAFFQQNSV
jgi:hypothetical protein